MADEGIAGAPPPTRATGKWRLAERHILPIALWALTTAVPLLEVLQANPGFFQAQGLVGVNVDAATAILILGVPVLLHLPFWLLCRLRGETGWRLELFCACWTFQWLAMRNFNPLAALAATTALAWLCLRALVDVKNLRRLATVALPIVWLARSWSFLHTPEIRAARNLSGPSQPVALQFQDRRTPIVFWVLDGFSLVSILGPDGTIDARHFPHFAQLAEESTWYRVTRTQSLKTLISVPQILTGVRETADLQGQSLVTLFNDSHRAIVLDRVISLSLPVRNLSQARIKQAFTDLFMVYLHLLAPPILETRLAPVNQGWMGFQTGDRFLDSKMSFDLLDNTPGRPIFFFRHGLFPHGPYRHREEGRETTTSVLGSAFGQQGTSSLYPRYFLQLKATDTLLGFLMDRLKSVGLWDSCLFVVISDHGVHNVPFGAGETEADVEYAAMYVPFFVKSPGQKEPKVVDQEARTIDVFPLLISLLHGQLPWKVDGQVPSQSGPPAPALARLKEVASLKYRRFDLGPATSVYSDPLLAPWYLQAVPRQDGEAEGLHYEHLNSIAYENVALTENLPLEIEARLYLEKAHGPARLVWTLNGRVASVTQWTGGPAGSSVEFGGPIAFENLREGANEAQLYLVEGDSTKTLTWKTIPTRGVPKYTLDPASQLVLQDQKPIPMLDPLSAEGLCFVQLRPGSWKLKLVSEEPDWSAIVLFDKSGGAAQQVLSAAEPPSSTALRLTLQEGQQPDQWQAYLLTPKGFRRLAWREL